MKRTFVLIITAVCAMLLAACQQTTTVPDEYVVEIITPEVSDAAKAAPSLPLLVQQSQSPEPPLTIRGVVDKADVGDDVIRLQLRYSQDGNDITLDITIDVDTTAVGDIYSLDSDSVITATVDAWAVSNTGYMGTATSVSVDNEPAVE